MKYKIKKRIKNLKLNHNNKMINIRKLLKIVNRYKNSLKNKKI